MLLLAYAVDGIVLFFFLFFLAFRIFKVMTYAVDGHESFVSSIATFFFFLFFFLAFPVFKVLPYAVDGYESSQRHRPFLAFPLSKVMSLICHMLSMNTSHLSLEVFLFV